MVSYVITSKFRSSNPIDFKEYTKELGNAVNKFNTASKKIGKNSILVLKNISKDDFELVLSSQVALSKPSKSLAKFSQALLGEQRIKEYVVGENQLIRCISTKIYNAPDTELTDGQFLAATVFLIHNTDCSTDSTELMKRRKLLADLKDMVKSSGLIPFD